MKQKLLLALSICLLLLVGCSSDDETKTAITSTQSSETGQTQTSEGNTDETVKEWVDTSTLSEEEYKALCKQMYYDEVFFGDEDLEGQLVKINVFVSEEYYFTNDDMYNESINAIYFDNNLYRDFLKCCVLREGTNSYVGEQITVFFSQDFGLNPSDYEPGDKIIIYAQVIAHSTNTWDGYNIVKVIPKYVEE